MLIPTWPAWWIVGGCAWIVVALLVARGFGRFCDVGNGRRPDRRPPVED